MSAKMWDVAVEHATRCVIDDNKLYLYCPQSHQRDGVVFNIVGQVLGLLSNCKYVVSNKLSETEKVSFKDNAYSLSLLLCLLHDTVQLVLF